MKGASLSALERPPWRSLVGQVAVITGAGDGLGRATAETLGEAGATVVIAELSSQAANEAVAELTDQGVSAVSRVVDVGDTDAVRAMVSSVVDELGRLDVLVNNAGFGFGGPSLEVTEADWDRLHRVMFRGVFFASQAAAKVMVANGGGRIVNICSRSGMAGYAERALYTGAKAGVIALTQVLGVEWARHNIRVNGISPGEIETRRNAIDIAEGRVPGQLFAERSVLGRLGRPREIAETVLFLASEASSYMTGEIVLVDGGWMAWDGIEEAAGVR